MCTLPSIVLLALGCVVVSFASRRWRLHGISWGIVPVAAAATAHCSPITVLGLAVVLTAIETIGRTSRLPEIVVVALVPVALWTYRPLTLSDSLVRLALIFTLAWLAFEIVSLARNRFRKEIRTVWADVAALLLLFAFSSLVVTGMDFGIPLLEVLGLAAPASIPSAMREIMNIQSAKLRLKNFADLSEWSTIFRNEKSTPTLASMCEDLHQIVRPLLQHSSTVIGLHPTMRYTGEEFAVFPPSTPADQQRIGERLHYLFRSGRCLSLPDVTEAATPESSLITPGFRREIVIPVRKNGKSLALIAFSGNAPALSKTELGSFARSIQTIMLHVFITLEEQRNLAFLSQRSEQESRRLRSLLKLNELIAESPDLRTLIHNLVRTVCVSFGFSWTAFLLREHEASDLKLVAWSGEGGNWHPSVSPLSPGELESALSLGSTLSRSHIVPLRHWPPSLPQVPNVAHLLVTPIVHGSQPVGYLLVLPNPLSPVPDLNDLRALEILLEQVGPLVTSSLHLEKVNRRTLQDALTNIANRRALDQFLQRAFSRAKKTRQNLAFAMLDIDDFKSINDRHGHQIGDVVLKEVAAALLKNVRTRDFVARYGGEEFSIVLPGLPANHARDVLERLRISLATTPFASGELSHPLSLTLSIGIATFPGDGDTPEALIQMADTALYRAKRHGKNCVVAAWQSALDTTGQIDEPFVL